MNRKEQVLDRKSQIEKALEEYSPQAEPCCGTSDIILAEEIAFRAGAEWADQNNPEVERLQMQSNVQSMENEDLEQKLELATRNLAIAVEALNKIMMEGLSDGEQQLPPNIQSCLAYEALAKIKGAG